MTAWGSAVWRTRLGGVMAQAVYVFLGDVERSRSARDRRLLRRRIESVCAMLNREHGAALAAPLKPLKGADEVGAVLRSVEHLYEMVDAFRQALRPSRMRTVVVLGKVDVGRTTDDVARMDGPAFHRAAEAMADLKRSGILFALDTGDAARDAAVNGLVNALLALKERWTAQQEKVARAYERAGSQEGAARRLRVTQQAVSETLRRMDHRRLRILEENLRSGLRGYGRPSGGGTG